MVAEGADLLDVGGESTRPGHAPVAADEERRRVVPVIAALRAALPDIPISVDTTKPAVAEAALDAGADLINDVWGVGADDSLAAPGRRSRRPARRHAQPGGGPLHDAPARGHRRPPARHRPRARARRRLGRPDRRSGVRLRQDGRAQPRARCATSARCGCSGGRSCSGTSRKSTLGRVLGPARRRAARGDPRDDGARDRRRRRPRPRPRRRARTSARRGSPTPIVRGELAARSPPKEAPAERPDRARQHALPGPPRLLRPRAPDAPAVRGRRRAAAQPAAGRRRRRPRASRSTTARSTTPSGRSSNRPRSACSRPWPRRSATSCWPTSR